MSEKEIGISIVTVCFNAESTIMYTAKSILSQNYSNLEYIVIDGQSSDNTLILLKELCDERGNIKIISERDNGIYDAMNKAISLATGEYVIFVNSGDALVDEFVIQNLVEKIKNKEAQIYYGNIIKTIDGKAIRQERYDKVRFNELALLRGSMVCHQALVVNTKLMKKKRFNTNYNIAADKNFIIECAKEKIRFKYIDLDICYYDSLGVSKKQKAILNRETKDILISNFPIGGRIKYYYFGFKKILFKR